jgi:hypothetical protein
MIESRRCFLTLIVHNSCFTFRKCLIIYLLHRPATMAGILWLSFVHPRTNIIFFNGSTALASLGLLYEVPRSHSDTTHTLGLLWASNQLVAETSTGQHTTTTEGHPCPRRDSNPLSQQASGRRSTP